MTPKLYVTYFCRSEIPICIIWHNLIVIETKSHEWNSARIDKCSRKSFCLKRLLDFISTSTFICSSSILNCSNSTNNPVLTIIIIRSMKFHTSAEHTLKETIGTNSQDGICSVNRVRNGTKGLSHSVKRSLFLSIPKYVAIADNECSTKTRTRKELHYNLTNIFNSNIWMRNT